LSIISLNILHGDTLGKLNVLVVGSGGREHAYADAISRMHKNLGKLYCAPGNGGTQSIATNVPYKAKDIDGLCDFSHANDVGLVVVGPEDPLVDGIADRLDKLNIPCFGHSAEAAQLEGSKYFAKMLMNKKGIPTSSYGTFTDAESAHEFLLANWGSSPHGYVIKANGLALGKGVKVCDTVEEAHDAVDGMFGGEFGEAGKRVVIEQRLVGEEASYIVMTNGDTYLALPSTQDHKPVFDGDKGDNTGGMGAYSPAPVVTDELDATIRSKIIEPTIVGMEERDAKLRGMLYAGIMVDKDGNPRVLEFNVRGGDPETQPTLMRAKSDIVPALMACARGEDDIPGIEWDSRPAVCVVMASKGYPGGYEKGKRILGLDTVGRMDDVFVFHAGTVFENTDFYTAGGRVLGVTALGKDIREAQNRAYDAVNRISCEDPGFHFRSDIAGKALNRVKWDQTTI
jgi:phosphoribosylamine--glycine ligase